MYNVGEEVVALKSYSREYMQGSLVKGSIYSVTAIEQCPKCGVVGVCVGISLMPGFRTDVMQCNTCNSINKPLVYEAAFPTYFFAPLSSLYRQQDEADIAEALQSTKVLQPQTA